MYPDAIEQAQRVLRTFAGYAGTIDGDAGPQSLAAASRIAGPRAEGGRPMTPERRVVAAAQIALLKAGHEAGPADGYWGPQTDAAYLDWRAAAGTGPALPRRDLRFGREADLEAMFGPAGGARCTAGRVVPPWRMVLAWDQRQAVSHITCHEAVAASLARILERVADTTDETLRRDLGLHLYGGCYNLRRKRGGADLSTHAYGVAVDLDPARNRLPWGRSRARLGRADAAPLWDAVAAEGWTSLGAARNFDWMHMQAPAP